MEDGCVQYLCASENIVHLFNVPIHFKFMVWVFERLTGKGRFDNKIANLHWAGAP